MPQLQLGSDAEALGLKTTATLAALVFRPYDEPGFVDLDEPTA